MHTTCSQMKNTETTDLTLLVKIGVTTSACSDIFFFMFLFLVLFLFHFSSIFILAFSSLIL